MDEEAIDDPDELEELYSRYEQLSERVNDAHECEPHLQLRNRARPAPARAALVYQCQVCGEQRGGAIGRARADVLTGGIEPPPFDFMLADAYGAQRSATYKEWLALRRRISELEQGPQESTSEIASGLEEMRVAEAEAEQRLAGAIEHLLGVHGSERGAARLLRATSEVHRALRADASAKVNRFRSEEELCTWLEEHLEEDFHVDREVEGRHLAEGKAVRIDYVLFPRQHLVDAGFAEEPIGVEAKYLNQDEGFTRKATRSVWQAISYMDSAFALPTGKRGLKAVLLFTNLSFDDERALLLQGGGRVFESDRSEWGAALGIANHARVGELRMFGGRDRWAGWCISFGGGKYFQRVHRKGAVRYVAGNRELLNKVRIGHF